MKSLNVKEHVPNFVSGVEPDLAHAGTLAELRALEFVAHWETDPDFDHFSVGDRRYLTAHMKSGKYWVVAYLDEPDLYGLPDK